MNRLIFVRSVSELCVHTFFPVESHYTKYVSRRVVRFSERLKSMLSADSSDTSLDGTEWPYAETFADSSQASLLFTGSRLRVWSFSSSVLLRIQTQAILSSGVSKRFVDYTYCTKTRWSVLDASVVTMLNRSSTFASQNLSGTSEVVVGKMKLFFNVPWFQIQQLKQNAAASFRTREFYDAMIMPILVF